MMNKRGILSVAIAVVFAVSFVGCGGDDGGADEPVSLVGIWDAVSAVLTSPELPNGSIAISSALGLLSGSITFDDDGTFSMNVTIPGESYAFSGTWSASGAELKITSAGEQGEASYVLTGSTLTVTYARDGSRIVISASKR